MSPATQVTCTLQRRAHTWTHTLYMLVYMLALYRMQITGVQCSSTKTTECGHLSVWPAYDKHALLVIAIKYCT